MNLLWIRALILDLISGALSARISKGGFVSPVRRTKSAQTYSTH